jgi:hypothetical protein
MKIRYVILELLHADRQANMMKIVGGFLQLFMANMPDSYFTLFHIKLSSSGTGANM